MPEKYRVKRIELDEDATSGHKLQTLFNQQAEEGYVPILHTTYLVTETEGEKCFTEIHTITLEHQMPSVPFDSRAVV